MNTFKCYLTKFDDNILYLQHVIPTCMHVTVHWPYYKLKPWNSLQQHGGWPLGPNLKATPFLFGMVVLTGSTRSSYLLSISNGFKIWLSVINGEETLDQPSCWSGKKLILKLIWGLAKPLLKFSSLGRGL